MLGAGEGGSAMALGVVGSGCCVEIGVLGRTAVVVWGVDICAACICEVGLDMGQSDVVAGRCDVPSLVDAGVPAEGFSAILLIW